MIPLFPFLTLLFLSAWANLTSTYYDNRVVKNSRYIGNEIHLAPLTTLVKQNKSGWKYDYFRPFFISSHRNQIENYDDVNSFKLDSYLTLKVEEVRYSTFGMGDKSEICIYGSIERPKIKVISGCDVERVNEVTDFYHETEDEIQKHGSADVEVFDAYFKRFKTLIPVKKYRNKLVYKINSMAELISLFESSQGTVDYYQLTNVGFKLIK